MMRPTKAHPGTSRPGKSRPNRVIHDKAIPTTARPSKDGQFEIFLAANPGLEDALYAEVLTHRFRAAKAVPGGVVVRGTWPDLWRANLVLRGASRVLARIGAFRVPQLSDLETRARQVPWGAVLRRDMPFTVQATCRKSRVYHSGAAEERIARAIHQALGAPHAKDAEVAILARIEDDLCTLSVDTSGELLHKRGFKEEIGKAPMRETLAALFLRQCGYTGAEPVVDPMCGSGTFVIEAAEMAAGLLPGRSRRFAFEQLATFDPAAWQTMRAARSIARTPEVRCHGSDRDAGAIRMSVANAERAGVTQWTEFRQIEIHEITAPEGPPGLVIVNPPYGERIGAAAHLDALYRTLGQTLMSRFKGWRVGLVASDPSLAKATGLPFAPPPPPIPHGGLRVTLYQTGPLGQTAPLDQTGPLD